MARGRIISKDLGESRKFANLQTDMARVVYMLVLANTDRGGRLEADPLYITRKVCTRLPYDQAQVEQAIENMADVGLIILYEVADVPYLQVVKFQEHNTPHHKEPDSDIPPPEGYDEDGNAVPDGAPKAQSKHGPSTSQARPKQADKRSKEKVREEKRSTRASAREADIPDDSSEARFERLADTGFSEHAETSRVRAALRRTAGPGFAKKFEDQLASWTRWTNDQIADLWRLAEPKRWPMPAKEKARVFLFEDLLNEARTPPVETPSGADPDEIRRKYHHVEGTHDGQPFIVVGITPSGSHLLTDIGPLTEKQVVEGSCRQAN